MTVYSSFYCITNGGSCRSKNKSFFSSTSVHYIIVAAVFVIGQCYPTGISAFVLPSTTRSIISSSNIIPCYQRHHRHGGARTFLSSSLSSSSSSSLTNDDENNIEKTKRLGDEIRRMRVKEIKEILKSLGLRTDDVFEKEELVLRLVDARMKDTDKAQPQQSSSSPPPPKTTRQTNQKTKQRTNTESPIIIPLQHVSTDGARPVSAINSILGEVTINARYAALRVITLTLPSSPSPNPTLTLMIDTACSGFVLRPSAVKRHGMPLSYPPGISITTAGGTAGGQGLSRLDNFELADGSNFGVGTGLGPGTGSGMDVAVQEIASLPPAVDGIIGLSFLERFGTVVFDFSRGELLLYDRDDVDPSKRARSLTERDAAETSLRLVTDADMNTCRLGIYTADVVLDGRGPVRALVDTGATATYLNWCAVLEDMNLGRDHPLVVRNRESLGAMGADSSALALTHRFVCRRRWGLVGGDTPFLTGLDLTEGENEGEGGNGVDIDIGDLPVLEQLKADGVNGILGADLLMKCDVLKLSFGRSSSKKRRIALFRKVGDRNTPYGELV